MFDRISTLPRRALAAGTAALMAVSLGSLGGAAAHASPPDAMVGTSGRAAPGPIHAGNTFGWYRNHLIRYEFVNGNGPYWRKSGHGQVANQHGMLTLNTATHGSVSAQMTIPGRAYGRWETRLRQRQYGHKHTPYRVLTELVPVTKEGEGCGEQNIALNKFTMGDNQVNFYIRSRPDNLFQASTKRGFGQDQWHTFAVEVTHRRISWFVDSHVIRTETRPEALSGRKFQVRFTMEAEKGKRMNKARMQMDWLRYWTLQAKNEKSTKAPLTKKTAYTKSCLGKNAPH